MTPVREKHFKGTSFLLKPANLKGNLRNEQPAGMLRATMLVSLLAALGSGISFLNQLVLAHIFGANSEMDAYLLAISVPLTISGLITGVLSYQLVPALQRAEVEMGQI